MRRADLFELHDFAGRGQGSLPEARGGVRGVEAEDPGEEVRGVIVDSPYVEPVRNGFHYGVCHRSVVEARIRQDGGDPAAWTLTPVACCLVCGNVAYSAPRRCWRHVEHTPCAVHGCTKGRKFKDGCWDDATWVCGIHWREVCPPRSALRRAYLRFYRTARRLGVESGRWPPELERRYWRFFRGMVARHHRRIGLVDDGAVISVELASADQLPAHLAQELRRAGLA